jgi:hypothetical protein
LAKVAITNHDPGIFIVPNLKLKIHDFNLPTQRIFHGKNGPYLPIFLRKRNSQVTKLNDEFNTEGSLCGL